MNRQLSFEPLTPTAFLRRAGQVFADRIALVDGELRLTYAELWRRSQHLAGALREIGVAPGERVAVLASNSCLLLESHYGVPLSGGVLVTLNTRLASDELAYILAHSGARVLLCDEPLEASARALAAKMDGLRLICRNEYETLLGGASAYRQPVEDERGLLALNYTSGTTARPKGVMYHHRGAYLQALAMALQIRLDSDSKFLWTLPMFHCNGWCFPWTLSVVAGTHVCLRAVRAPAMYDAIAQHKVTHLCGAPIVMSTLLNAPAQEKKPLPHIVQFATAAAPPPEAVLAAMKAAGFNVTHLYGLTETYGPAAINDWHSEWEALNSSDQAAKKARQGVAYPVLDALDVIDPETMRPVPRDGETLGEVMFRGNVVMKGYLKNKKASHDAFAGGWFHSGDLGVIHPDGYIQLKDRSKDIIISGGENISSIEVEDALYKHPAVQVVAVVAKPDEKWGETPCAVVELKPGSTASADELIAWCKNNLASYKCPRHILFAEIPKTSTGKLQKFKLRELVKAM